MTKGWVAAHGTFVFLELNTATNVAYERDRATTDQSVIALCASFSPPPAIGVWSFIAAQLDPTTSTNCRILCGGDNLPVREPSAYATQRTGTGAFTSNAGISLIVGQRGDDTANIDGMIAFFACWNRLLTVAEMEDVRQISARQAGLVLTPPPALAIPAYGNVLWSVYGDNNLIQIDQSPYNNHGSVTGAVPVNPKPNVSLDFEKPALSL
jgi:hypothetical protein